MPLLSVSDLTVSFHTRHGIVRAARGISFSLEPGGTMGLVGESGSGKSVTCYALTGLLPTPPARVESGTAFFHGADLLRMSEAQLRHIRGARIGMIFQDPMTSLTPTMKIGHQLCEPLLLHERITRRAAKLRAAAALEEVGIQDPDRRMEQYPHEFSGGMRQRVMIAMALITRPSLLIADEPTTALDVTIQKQVLELIKDRQRRLGTAVIFITHDLAVVSEICDHLHVMYAGRVVESGPTAHILRTPQHAYTRALLQSIPALQQPGQRLYTIPGAPPDPMQATAGCAFRVRNLTGGHQCLTTADPPLIEAAPGHYVQDCPGCRATSAA